MMNLIMKVGRKLSLAKKGSMPVKSPLKSIAIPTTCRPPNLSAKVPPMREVVK